jgi:exodeoxyribonuclease VII large subunit
MERTDILTVSQVTGHIKQLLEGTFRDLQVSGEIVGFKQHSSGHLYFTLKDSGARLAAMVFRSRVRFLAVRPEELRDGSQVRCRGRLSVYEPHGAYKIIVDQIQFEGRGRLLEELENRKRQLDGEGLFDDDRKQELPYLPSCVGIVTASTGAAIQDLLRILEERCPVRVKLYPAKVQGDDAPPDIVQGIRQLDADPDVEVIIVGRGGGAFEDLLPFSDERVVRAIAACRTPIVSAVGHEIDFPLSDLVADQRAPTPTAAAQLVVPERSALVAWLAEQRQQLDHFVTRCLDDAELALADRHARLADLGGRRLDIAGARIESLQARLAGLHPRVRLDHLEERLAQMPEALARALRGRLDDAGNRLESQANLLKQLGPEAQFKRGYSLVRKPASGELVTRHDQVGRGDSLEVLLDDGGLDVSVTDNWRKRQV